VALFSIPTSAFAKHGMDNYLPKSGLILTAGMDNFLPKSCLSLAAGMDN